MVIDTSALAAIFLNEPERNHFLEKIIQADIEIVSVDETQAAQARSSFRQDGKGRHPAGLNFGDCFTHALAVVSGEPILAKGSEFRRANSQVID
jgi:ribonuclease VapC